MFRAVAVCVAFAAAEQPVINVALAPSADPLPSVSHLISRLESQRAEIEAGAANKLNAAFSSALARAKARIHAAVGGSFLRANDNQVVYVKTLSTPGVAPSVLKEIAKVEKYRETIEKNIIDMAASEFDSLANVVIGEASRPSFLKADTLNVRVQPGSHSFPTVAELVKVMEAKRDLSEEALQGRILDLQKQFLSALNQELASSLA